MASTRTNPEQTGRLLAPLRKLYPAPARERDGDPLGRLIRATLALDASETRANSAYKRLTDTFVDWNDVRVAPPAEVAEVLGNLPDALDKAEAINIFLNRIFELSNMLGLDFLKSKTKREARAYLEGLDGVAPSAAASVMLNSLDGHAVPVDPGSRRLLVRLGVFSPEIPTAQMQSVLERHVAAKDAFEFVTLMRRHAEEICLPGEPKCKECPLLPRCPTGKLPPGKRAVPPEARPPLRVAKPQDEFPIPGELRIATQPAIADAGAKTVADGTGKSKVPAKPTAAKAKPLTDAKPSAGKPAKKPADPKTPGSSKSPKSAQAKTLPARSEKTGRPGKPITKTVKAVKAAAKPVKSTKPAGKSAKPKSISKSTGATDKHRRAGSDKARRKGR